MGEVAVGLTMSLDGFIVGPNDGPERPLGKGGERLFEWYSGGDTEYEMPGTGLVFRISPQSVELLREVSERMGAIVTGRRTFDIANGWGGNPRWVSRPLSSPTRCRRSGSTKGLPTPLSRTVSEGRRAGEEGCGGQGRRRGRSEHRAAVHKGRAARRGTRQPGVRLARRGCQVVRAPGDADRP